MQRRKFLIGAGSLAAGGAAATGTGAFSSVQAERNINIETANDAGSFLGIEPYPSSEGENGELATEESDGTVSLDFTSTSGAGQSSTGLNKDAFTNIENVLKITNNSTQTVFVAVNLLDGSGNQLGTDVGALAFGISGNSTGPDFVRGSNAPAALGNADEDGLDPGESAGMGFFFEISDSISDGSKFDSFETAIDAVETLEIVAGTKDEIERFTP